MSTANGLADWESLPAMPSPNGGFACGVTGGKIVVLGGTNWKEDAKQWLDSIWTFDPKKPKWETRGKLPHPLAYAVTATWEGDLLIAGGTDGSRPRQEVWRIGPSLKLRQAGHLSEAAVLAAGGVLWDKLYILGGCADPAKLEGLRRGGERLDLRSGGLAALSQPGEPAIGLAAGLVLESELFIFGGLRPEPLNSYTNLNAAWALDPARGEWRKLAPYPLLLHGSAAVDLDHHRILIAGGHGGSPPRFSAAAFIYDRRQDSYVKTIDLPFAGIVGLVRAGDSVYVLGGEDNLKHRSAACARVKVAALLDTVPKE